MLKPIFRALLIPFLLIGTLLAATDPFVGDWKLNLSKSKLVDHMKVESLGGNKYEFDLGGGPERIVADGTDQAAAFGTMLSVRAEEPDTWKVVRKKDGRTLLTGNWKLSQDGKTLTDNYTEFDPKRVAVHDELPVHANGRRARVCRNVGEHDAYDLVVRASDSSL